MRNICTALVILASSAATATAQEELRILAPTPNARSIVSPSLLPEATVSPDDVIARVLSFDRDRDGKVAASELSERMQDLVARGDRSGDGALDASEIRTLATSPQFVASAIQNLSGGYGFADTAGQSSRNHIEDSIDDLRLATNASQEAKRIAVAFVEEFEAAALANLRRTVAPLIDPDRQAAFTAGLFSPQLERDLKSLASLKNLVAVNGNVTTVSIPNLPRLVLNKHQLSVEQMTLAEAAADTFKNEQQFDEARQSALVARLSDLLTGEESENLRAALARRPLARGTGLSAGFQRVTASGFTVTPIVR